MLFLLLCLFIVRSVFALIHLLVLLAVVAIALVVVLLFCCSVVLLLLLLLLLLVVVVVVVAVVVLVLVLLFLCLRWLQWWSWYWCRQNEERRLVMQAVLMEQLKQEAVPKTCFRVKIFQKHTYIFIDIYYTYTVYRAYMCSIYVHRIGKGWLRKMICHT